MVDAMSVKMLRAQLIDRRISPVGMIEKCEMRRRLKRAACFDAPCLIYASPVDTALDEKEQAARTDSSCCDNTDELETALHGELAESMAGAKTDAGTVVEVRVGAGAGAGGGCDCTHDDDEELPEEEANLTMKRIFVVCLQAERWVLPVSARARARLCSCSISCSPATASGRHVPPHAQGLEL